jgi:elongation factor P
LIETADFRKGLKVEIDDEPYIIVDFQHVKPGKGNQFTRTKLKSLLTGYQLERTYRSGEKLGKPDIEEQDCTFLYNLEGTYNFMDQTSYEQYEIPEDVLGDSAKYLVENLKVNLLFFRGRAVNIDLPNFVEMTVTQSDPGVKGDTASGGSKPATMETGLTIQVPFHINEGDVLRVDTRSCSYGERVKRA